MQNHAESYGKHAETVFLASNRAEVEKESQNLDMSGPAKASPGGQVLVSKAGFSFSVSEIIHFQSLLTHL